MKDHTLTYSKRSFSYAIINVFLVALFILISVFKSEGANRNVSLLFGIIFCVLSTLCFSGIYLYHRGAKKFTLWKRRFSFIVHNCIAVLILLWFLAIAAHIAGFID